ncbi:hypothetical protein J6TS2_36780 [Heyndrickxia sporothermodurans]|nr:hypothetical protein J6TS2_36780 [Heyndrickxia sporothermodurans]
MLFQYNYHSLKIFTSSIKYLEKTKLTTFKNNFISHNKQYKKAVNTRNRIEIMNKKFSVSNQKLLY